MGMREDREVRAVIAEIERRMKEHMAACSDEEMVCIFTESLGDGVKYVDKLTDDEVAERVLLGCVKTVHRLWPGLALRARSAMIAAAEANMSAEDRNLIPLRQFLTTHNN